MRALVVPEKAERVHDFHKTTMETLKELIAAAGLHHPRELGPEHIIRRISSKEVRSLAGLHKWVRTDDLNQGIYRSPVFKSFWEQASYDSFSPPASLLARQRSKSG
jgi:hypothetical protein